MKLIILYSKITTKSTTSYLLFNCSDFKSRSTFFGLLRKSLPVRGKSKLKMRLIFTFSGEFVRFFENSKNQKFQALDRATFDDTSMYENVKIVFKLQNYVFFEPLKTA